MTRQKSTREMIATRTNLCFPRQREATSLCGRCRMSRNKHTLRLFPRMPRRLLLFCTRWRKKKLRLGPSTAVNSWISSYISYLMLPAPPPIAEPTEATTKSWKLNLFLLHSDWILPGDGLLSDRHDTTTILWAELASHCPPSPPGCLLWHYIEDGHHLNVNRIWCEMDFCIVYETFCFDARSLSILCFIDVHPNQIH